MESVFYTGTCGCTCLHTARPSEKLQAGCCLHRCLVCQDQHSALCFYWPSEPTGAPQPWSLPPPTTTHTHTQPNPHTKHLRQNVKGVKEQGRGQSLEVCELLPGPQGPWTGLYKQERAWPPGIGTLSQWKRLALDDSASDTAQEEWRDTALSQTVSRLSKIGLLIAA